MFVDGKPLGSNPFHTCFDAHKFSYCMYSYDLIDLERGHGGYGGNVGDQWCAVNPTDGSFTKDACFASGW